MSKREPLLTILDVSERLNVTPGTIRKWGCIGRDGFPKGTKLGPGRSSPRRWEPQEIEDFLTHLKKAR